MVSIKSLNSWGIHKICMAVNRARAEAMFEGRAYTLVEFPWYCGVDPE